MAKGPRIRLNGRPIPASMDPYGFYTYRALRDRATVGSFESYLYRILPYEIIRSFAIAIDPFYEFKVGPQKVAKSTRRRVTNTQSVLGRVQRKYHGHAYSYGIKSNGQPYPYTSATVDQGPSTLSTQTDISRLIEDTSKSTRPIGQEQGEFFLFKSNVVSPSRTIVTETYGLVGYTDPIFRGEHLISRSDKVYSFSPMSATIRDQDVRKFIEDERTFLLDLISSRAIKLYSNLDFRKRTYSLSRNLFELRDIPSSILSLKRTCENLQTLYDRLKFEPKLSRLVHSFKTSAKDVPNEYLSYMFGWRQTYSDLLGLLSTPAKVAKKFNFLLSRAGKDTTFRSKMVIPSRSDGGPPFQYYLLDPEGELPGQLFTTRNTELRMVVNKMVNFPKIDTPDFRERFFLKELGVAPTLTDMYNITPWTWLFDWFTGLGDYVQMIENINSDPQLVNWGVVTAVTDGSVSRLFRTEFLQSYSNVLWDSNRVITESKGSVSHESRLDYKCQIRINAADALKERGVSIASDLDTLSLYQKSIIGALLAQRTGKW